MKRAGKLTAIMVALAATFSLAAPLTSASAGTKAEAADVLELHNQARRDHGERALSMDRRIARYAKRHSKQMAEKGYLFHTSSLSGVLHRRQWQIAGENVGVGGDLQSLMDAFMNSTDHRKNVLRGSYHEAGVGVYKQKLDNEAGTILYWVTVVFYG